MTKFLHSRAMLVLASLLALGCALACVGLAGYPPALQSFGLAKAWSGEWVVPQPASMWIAVGLNIGIAAMLAYVNKAFNLLRCLTMLQGTVFLFMQMASSRLLVEVNPGLALCFAWIVCMLLLFPNFSASMPQKEVFLAFAIMSGMSACVDEALILIPGLWLACGQMRIFNIRTVLASLMGLACPWIIFFGFCLIGPDGIQPPSLLKFGDALSGIDSLFLALLAFTVFLGAVCWVQNFMKYLTYTAKYRAYQGFVTVSMLLCVLGIACDVADSLAILPVLNVCVALQVAHLFGVIHFTRKSWIPILIILLIYLFLSYPFVLAWQMIAYVL
ncbi:MAG: hypothetical protein NC548_63635 [Lachnospiraceae bacterium]|nr:hypothetical protein [Lachnospiraceae bacterium]